MAVPCGVAVRRPVSEVARGSAEDARVRAVVDEGQFSGEVFALDVIPELPQTGRLKEPGSLRFPREPRRHREQNLARVARAHGGPELGPPCTEIQDRLLYVGLVLEVFGPGEEIVLC